MAFTQESKKQGVSRTSEEYCVDRKKRVDADNAAAKAKVEGKKEE